MSRTLKRPMFRKGGEVMEGIMTGIKPREMFSEKGVPVTEKIIYPVCNEALTDQSRTTHPAFKYRDLPQTREYPLFLNPQENLCFKFHNNLNTRLLERDNYIPKIPCLKKKKYILTK